MSGGGGLSWPGSAGVVGATATGVLVTDSLVADSLVADTRIRGAWPADVLPRRAGDRVRQHLPQVIDGARAGRAFGARVVRYLGAWCSVRQYLVIGAGLPAGQATHDIAQSIDPRCRVVYADGDPLVVARARSMLGSTPEGACDYVQADLRDPQAILDQAARTLDCTEPVALLLFGVAHFLPDADNPAAVIAGLAGAMATGSYLAISHLSGDAAPGAGTFGAPAGGSRVIFMARRRRGPR
jgi:hypothetical protein